MGPVFDSPSETASPKVVPSFTPQHVAGSGLSDVASGFGERSDACLVDSPLLNRWSDRFSFTSLFLCCGLGDALVKSGVCCSFDACFCLLFASQTACHPHRHRVRGMVC